jgi:hypothetical protein
MDEPAAGFDYVLQDEAASLGYSTPGGAAQPRGATGLALSGGGIRSATFCLGVIQALALPASSDRLIISPRCPAVAISVPGRALGSGAPTFGTSKPPWQSEDPRQSPCARRNPKKSRGCAPHKSRGVHAIIFASKLSS